MILSVYHHEILNFLGTRWWPAGEATSSGNKLWKDVTHLPSFGAKWLSATHSLISKSHMCKIRQTSNLGPGAPDYPALCLSRNAICHMGIDNRSTCDIPKSCMLSSKQHICLTKMQPKVIFLNSNKTQNHSTIPRISINRTNTWPTANTHFFIYYCGWKKCCITLDGWNPIISINNRINHLSTGFRWPIHRSFHILFLQRSGCQGARNSHEPCQSPGLAAKASIPGAIDRCRQLGGAKLCYNVCLSKYG